MTILALLILSLYQLVGLAHAPLKATLENSLHPAASSHYLASSNLPAAVPVKKGAETLGLGDAAVYAVDIASGRPIVSVNADKAFPIASLTKLTTALVLLESHAAGETVTVPAIGPYGSAD